MIVMLGNTTVYANDGFGPTIHQLRELQRAGARVVASARSAHHPMLTEADHAFLEERIPDTEAAHLYPEYILERALEHGAHIVLAGRWARYLVDARDTFERAGVKVIGACGTAVHDVLDDKAAFPPLMPSGVRVVETHVPGSVDEFEALVQAIHARGARACFKPRVGVYGLGFRILDAEPNFERVLSGDTMHLALPHALDMLRRAERFPDLVVMPVLPGMEYSVDAVCHRGDVAFAVTRAKRKDAGGNVQELLHRPDIEEQLRLIARHFDLSGIVNAQFKDDDAGAPHLLEVNPRASGGLRFSMRAGAPFAPTAASLELGWLTPDRAPQPQVGKLVVEVREARDLTALDADESGAEAA